jgi:hypothetical protein
VLSRLLSELLAYPAPAPAAAAETAAHPFGDLVVPLRMHSPRGVLSFFSTTTVFGTPVEVTLSELAIELFFPADKDTAMALAATRDA